MKYMLVALLSLMFASTAFANDSVVRWNTMVGVITALNVNKPIADIDSGTFAWTTRSGHGRVNLNNGATIFDVRGLSINGTVFSGTPGPITAVTGTLVCDAGEADEEILDTDEGTPLSRDTEKSELKIGQGNGAMCRPFVFRCLRPYYVGSHWAGTERGG